MVSIPRAIAAAYGIEPGWKLEWIPGDEPDQLTVRCIPGRGRRAERLYGAGRTMAGDGVAGLVAEREREER